MKRRKTSAQHMLPIKQQKYVVVTKETAEAIRLHDEMTWSFSEKLVDALAPCGGLHIDHQAALVAINDMLIAYRYIGRLIQRSMEEGIFIDGYTPETTDDLPF